MKSSFKSKVYTDRPAYADFDAPQKFEAIFSIVASKLMRYPNAICSYSGGSDSDIMLHMIEMVRKNLDLPPVSYCFFNTGLEMDAIKRHVHDMERLYGVEIAEHRPAKNIVQSAREHGIPFVSKIMSAGLEGVQKKHIPLSIAAEYAEAMAAMLPHANRFHRVASGELEALKLAEEVKSIKEPALQREP